MEARDSGSTRVRVALAWSRDLDKRVRTIATKKNLPYREVVVQLVIAGLDTTQDLELAEPVPHA